MWERVVDGRELTFRLAGINNQNFLMRDEETGSFWQQISGEAISGPYRGRRLKPVPSEEIAFATWRAENPGGTVLRPVGAFASQYESKTWEAEMRKARTVVDTRDTPYGARELMLGVEIGGVARAYVLDRVFDEKLIQDRVGGTPVIVVAGPDGKSVRVFEARLKGNGEPPEFYYATEGVNGTGVFMDSATGGRWNFQGCAVSGTAAGECLRAVSAIRDYWFDWHLYHPMTTVFSK